MRRCDELVDLIDRTQDKPENQRPGAELKVVTREVNRLDAALRRRRAAAA
jgi:hypothetical protein